jgi:hypothetical protein
MDRFIFVEVSASSRKYSVLLENLKSARWLPQHEVLREPIRHRIHDSMDLGVDIHVYIFEGNG